MKALHFLLIPALAAMAVSCSNNDEVLQPEQQADGTTTVRGTTEYAPATRTIFGAPTKGEDGNTTISLTWNEDPTTESVDVIGFDASGKPSSSFSTFDGVKRSADGKSMEFDVSNGYPTIGITAEKYVYLYPSGAFGTIVANTVYSTAKFTTTQIQSENNNLDHLSAVNWMYSDAVGDGVDFTLHPLGAILRFDLTFPTVVTGGTIKLSSNKNSFIDGAKVSYSGGTASVSWTGSFGFQSLEIKDISTDHVIAYMMVGATSDFKALPTGTTLTLSAEMTTTEGSKTYTHTLGTTKADKTWEPGKCYNFTVTAAEFKTNPTWAASNIYWDGKQLTFDPAGATTTNPYYQGVYFKWGSLVGISPAQSVSGDDTWKGDEPVYVPTYSSPSTASWTKSSYTKYEDIPYESATGLTPGTTVNSLNDTQWANNIGDICQFISATSTTPALAGYRMPRADEFGTDGDWGKPAGSSGTILNDANGTADLTDKVHTTWTATGAIFPAAGYRFFNGTLYDVGSSGYYWSSSAKTTGMGYNLRLYSTGVTVGSMNSSNRLFAYPVRCVKD